MAQVIHGEFGLANVEPTEILTPSLRQKCSVAALNLSPKPGEVEENLLLAERAIVGAKRAHPDLGWVVLPELFTSGYSNLASIHRYAEDAEEGVSVRFFASLARDLGLYVAYGFPERLPGTTGAAGVCDSAHLVGPDGVALTYRKRHLVRTTGEDHVFVSGTELPVVETGGVRVAFVICWDLGFPEVAREAALAGADLILVPAGGSAVRALVRLACAGQRRLPGERQPAWHLSRSAVRCPGPCLRPRWDAPLEVRGRTERRRG